MRKNLLYKEKNAQYQARKNVRPTPKLALSTKDSFSFSPHQALSLDRGVPAVMWGRQGPGYVLRNLSSTVSFKRDVRVYQKVRLQPAKRIERSEEDKVVQKLIYRYNRLLSNKSFRRDQGTFILSGLNALQACPVTSLKSIITCSNSRKLVEEYAREFKGSVYQVSTGEFSQLGNEKNPSGVMAEAEQFPIIDIDPQSEFESNGKYLGINGLREGANLGLLVRTAVALGWDGIVLIGNGNVDPFNIQVVRASSGSIWQTKFFRCQSFEHFPANFQILLAEVPEKAAESVAPSQPTEGGPLLLVIGNEQDGHSLLPKRDYKTVSVETKSSLNAAIAGAILMNELRDKTTLPNK